MEACIAQRYKWVLVGALFLVSLVNYADRTAITAVYVLLKPGLGFSDVGLGAIGSMFLWSYALASPLAGYFGDRSNRTRLILWSLFGWSAATLLTGLVVSRWQLLGMRAVLGLAESLYMPAAMAMVAQYHGQETRATALGVLNIGNYVGLVGGGAIGGYLGGRFGWRSPLCVLGLAGIALAALCYFILPRAEAERASASAKASPSFQRATMSLLAIPSFLVLAAAGVLTAIGTWIFINWLPLYFHESLGMTLAAAGFLGSSVVSVSAAVSQALGGVTSDRIARRGVHYRMLMQAVLILCAAPTLLAFLYTRQEGALMSSLVLYSVFRSSADLNIVPLLCDLAGKDKQSTAIGITNMLNTVAGGLGVFIAGFLKSSFGLAGVFAGVGAILALDAALLFAGYWLFLKKDLCRSTL